MLELYKKTGNRKYEILNYGEYTGFPVDGIWIVNDIWQSFAFSINTFSNLKISFFLKRNILVDKLINSKKSVMECLAETFQESIIEKERYHRTGCPETLYEKKNGKYKKYGEIFTGFPSSGVYEVVDGRNNEINFLGHFSDFPEIDTNLIKDIEINVDGQNKSIFEYAGDLLDAIFQEYEKKLQN